MFDFWLKYRGFNMYSDNNYAQRTNRFHDTRQIQIFTQKQIIKIDLF